MRMPVARMQIGEVAQRTGLSLRTIRFYEEAGILSASRSSGGFRLFDEADVQRLLVVRRMKPLGFSVAEMHQLLAMLDTAADASGSSATLGLADRLAPFQARVHAKVAAMRDQLDSAEAFAADLDARVVWARRREGASA